MNLEETSALKHDSNRHTLCHIVHCIDSITLKKACDCYLICFIAYIVSSIAIMLLDLNENVSDSIWMLGYYLFVIMSLCYLIVFPFFNYVVMNNMQMYSTKRKIAIVLLSLYTLFSFVAFFADDIPFSVLDQIVILLFYFVLIRYGVAVYRQAIWFAAYASVLSMLDANILSNVLSIISLAILYDKSKTLSLEHN